MAKFGVKQNRRIHIKDEDVNISADGMTYHMIAKILGLSVQEVKNIENSAIRKMQIPNIKNKELREYLKISITPNASSESGM
ncbi:MAG: hypothetical protein J7L15_04840 [Clostridiales bacterium]|nr:hypothetical protein [Clostridiales bacterium]